MKKFDFEEFKAQIIFLIICFVFFASIFFFNYIEESYELTDYLWYFNGIILIIVPLYYLIHNIREKNKTKRIENEIIIKNIDFQYYRDIIEEYSPALLSFILDGTEVKKDFSASIIYLINKGYLELTEDNMIKKTTKNINDLPEDLQIICNNTDKIFDEEKMTTFKYPSGNYHTTSNATMIKIKWGELIQKQAVEKGLVTERKKWRLTSFLSILCILEAIYTISIDELGLCFFSVGLVFLLMFIKFWVYDENKWVKTQKGYEIYMKVVGLKNYINDYSMLSESELVKINLWEDYLIYAIIFNNTSKLNKENMEFYNRLFKHN